MKKLNNVQKLAVQTLVREEKSVEEMSETLKVSVDVINGYLEELLASLEKNTPAPKVEEKAKPKKKKIKRTSADIGMVTKTPGGRDGVTVMTESASERIDAHHAAGKYNGKKSERHKGCIYRPQTDEIE